ncbi:zinc ribbon domain-containing protein [Deinococcus aestuarii]|uniref:zinc ribbon domain-containing protein n=1 Tax=Deinococcus aestuarii TaxID=2774531 RepID=UPI001C0D2F57|nr:zinc ribbon domain-containing protein [Deinococcus aestuarii]
MARHDPDRYWVQIKTPSYPAVRRLTRRLQPLAGGHTLCGPVTEAVWQVRPTTELLVLSDEELRIDGEVLHAELNHLPTHAYCALVAGSPEFSQYGHLGPLYDLVRRPAGTWTVTSFTALLEETVRAGRTGDREPRLVVPPRTYAAEWWPGETYLGLTPRGHWMLALTFRASYRPAGRTRVKVAVGLDLGLDPLTVAYDRTGESRIFPPTSLEHLRSLGRVTLSAPARRLLHHLVYASGRQDAERVIGFLNCTASHVYAERLTHRGMSPGFVHTARERAVHDHHFSHLSQLLHTSGVVFRRVPAAYTSVTCARCLERDGVEVRGRREGRRFSCPRCRRTVHADVNAGHNVLLRGLRLPPLHR